MTNVAVIYYSSTGSTYKLAEAAADAARKAGADVRLRKIAELDPQAAASSRDGAAEHRAATADIPVAAPEDLEWADAILLGSPVHFGLPAPQLMHFINGTSALSIPGKLLNKAVSAFASGSANQGGQVSTILALHNAICHWGSVIVPTGSTEPVLYEPNNGNPYGVSSTTKNAVGHADEENLAAIDFQTRRTMEIAAAIASGTKAV
ncbi:NAD(P)H-dependent oxidoreductase [Streptomyces silvisoli]|uniref:NAD(P)H-dependent oxidoreductase n=1 Tax=Streptomyces silvisoli TaxID=3034235 RepID=A0ABT5ZRG2_9ACTN|nr:NAD(P)H-dependent oxidoreductase [Streptomyces silvisoli]MDF3292195.1 NAD(P)H-dependent oxidoreductase [Streptomyces silvisoli]